MLFPGFHHRLVHILVITHCGISIDRAGHGGLLVVIAGTGGISAHASGDVSLRGLTASPSSPTIAAIADGVAILGAGRRPRSRGHSDRQHRRPTESSLHRKSSQKVAFGVEFIDSAVDDRSISRPQKITRAKPVNQYRHDD